MKGPWGFDDTWIYRLEANEQGKKYRSLRVIRPTGESLEDWRKRARSIVRKNNLMGKE